MKKTLPTRMKVIRGTLRKNRVLENEMKGTALLVIPAAPETLTGKGKIFWEVTGNNLIKQGIMVREDLLLFGSYCFLLEIIEDCMQEIKKQNLVCALKNKKSEQYYSKNKYFSAYLDCVRVLISIGSEFGLSPASRTRIPAGIKNTQNDLDRLMFND